MQAEPRQTEKNRDAQRPNGSRMALLASPEGKVLLIGLALALVYTVWLVVKVVMTPQESQFLIGLTATLLVFGRAAGLAFGYNMELPHSTVIPIAMIVETFHVLGFYPLFVFSWRHLLVLKSLRNVFDHIHTAAERHKDKIQRYGIIGLLVFVWFPFWMTGPVVGSVVGFLLGLPVWLNLLTVLVGTYVAILAWALFLHKVHEQVSSYDPYAAMVLVVVVIAVAVAGHVLRRPSSKTNGKNKD